jgi:hypothetical protein
VTRGATSTSIWIAKRPEDELADAIAADDRRKTMDALKVRVFTGIDRKRMVATLKSRVDAGRPKDTGGAGRSATTIQRDGAHHVNRPASPASTRKQGLHDPFGTCSTCRDYRRAYPDTTLTAGGMPKGCPPHAWNEKPMARRAWMR